jgi:dihydrofolate synthase/folylpolyglutamate synthase
MDKLTLTMFSQGGKPVSDLSRFTALCNALGNPQNDLKFVHIAGTNGKGSVSEYISRALTDAGFRTGKFTSPYVFNIRERIQFQNRLIGQKDFDTCVAAAISAAVGRDALGAPTPTEYSQFEILTAAAFLYFKKKKADLVVLETGIGGLLDCTNIVTPEISVITSIGYDHADVLGAELSDIARHKAGIIKAAPCVMYPVQERDAYVEFRKQCEKTGAELIIPELEALGGEKTSVYGNEFSYKGVNFTTIMGGKHQILNALTAIEALRELKIPEKHIKSGVKHAEIPARLQILRRNPLIVLDGAHNRQGIAAAKALFDTWKVRKAVVFGMLGGKDYIGALQELGSFAHFIVLTDGFAENAVSCTDLHNAALMLGFGGNCIYTVGEPARAVEIAAELSGGGLVLVTGSIRLASSINN